MLHAVLGGRIARAASTLAAFIVAVSLVGLSSDALAKRGHHKHSSNKLHVKKLLKPVSARLKLMVFECGTIRVNDLSVFDNVSVGETLTLNNTCFYIEHPKKGGLIWDTGLDDALVELTEPLPVLGGVLDLKVDNTLISQLEENEIDPSEIKYLAVSHLHFDHSGNMKHFSNAKWLVQKSERDLAFSDEAEAAGFTPEHYEMFSRRQTKTLRGHYDVFGDGSVIILSTPGHSVGHQALLVKLKDYGPILLSGDLYHFQANRDNYGIPVFNDKKSTINSFAFIDEVLDATGAELWIQHDPERYQKTNLAPFVYQ